MKPYRYVGWMVLGVFCAISLSTGAMAAKTDKDPCIACHQKSSPGQVADWKASKHSKEDVGCIACHGEKHMTAEDYKLAVLPDEKVCAECHEDQFNQFIKGKHNLGWSSLMALPVSPLEPDELIEGGGDVGDATTWGSKASHRKKSRPSWGTCTRTIPVTNATPAMPFPRKRP